jgi:hypothetical protein
VFLRSTERSLHPEIEAVYRSLADGELPEVVRSEVLAEFGVGHAD